LLGTAAVGAGVYKNLGSPNLSYINPFSSSFLGGSAPTNVVDSSNWADLGYYNYGP
jgi:hypothetical protein